MNPKQPNYNTVPLFQPIQSKNISDGLRKTLDIVLGGLLEKDSYQEQRPEKDHHMEKR